MIAIDASDIKTGGGIGYVVRGLLNQAKKEQRSVIFVFDDEKTKDQFLQDNQNKELVALVIPRFSLFRLGAIGRYRQIKKMLVQYSPEKFISPTITLASLFIPNTYQIINDFSPLDKAYNYFSLKDRIKFRVYLQVSKRYVVGFYAISESVQKQAKKLFGIRKSQVIHLGLKDWAFAEKASGQKLQDIQSKYNFTGKYLFSLGTLQPRKNYKRMIQAFAEFSKQNQDYVYIIAGGKGWIYDDIFSLVKELKLESKVKFIGYIDDSEIQTFYDYAHASLFVSLDEGFGLPVIDAYARKCPSVVSDIPVFKEFQLDDGVVYCNPQDINSISLGITKAANDSFDFNSDLSKYSWKKVLDLFELK